MPRRDALVEQFRSARRDPALAVLEGFHALKHALRFGARIERVVATDPAELEALAGVLAPDLGGRFSALAEVIPPDVFERLSPHAPRTGVMALAPRPRTTIDEALARPGPAILLEDPRNLSNMGACVRVAAAGDAAAVLAIGTHDPWHPDAIRGGAGLHFALPVVHLAELPTANRPLIAIDPEGDDLSPRSLPDDAILAFGTERYGLSEELLAAADGRFGIPMRDGVSSLNLATTVAAVLFAWRLCGGR